MSGGPPRPSTPRALLETALLGATLTWGLALLPSEVPGVHVVQGLQLLAVPAAALLLALRRPSPPPPWMRRVGQEAGAALGFLAVCAALRVLLAWGRGLELPLTGLNREAAGLPLTWALVLSTVTYALPRAAVLAWHRLAALARRTLLGAILQAQLTTAGLLVLGLALLGGLLIAGSHGMERFVPPGGSTTASLATRLFVGLLPFLGLLLVGLGAALLALLPLAALISWWTARGTARRLSALAAAARALREGRPVEAPAVEGEDEVAWLQADFQAMAAELQRTLGALRAEKEQVAALLESRRALVANVSHELRTPVATVRGYLESSLSSWKDAPPPTLREDLEVAEREVVRLQGLLDELFTLARADAGGLEVRPEPTDVGPLVRRLVGTAAPLAWRTAKVEVLSELATPLPPARADARRLEQVLGNLLHNALRHTPPGGLVAVGARAEPDAVVLEVRDTGEGISPEELPRVWERFHRSEEARAREPGGGGLGLALVRELTEAMGGTVGATSTPGEGSCFTVRLPLA